MAKKSKQREARYASAKTAAKAMGTMGPSTFKVPSGMSVVAFDKKGKYHIDLMPYVVGKGNPAKDVSEGDAYWERTYFVHKGAGLPHPFTCNKLTFGKKCAACKKVAAMASDPDADDDLVGELKPKKRMLMLAKVKEQEDKGVQLFEQPFYKSFGAMMKDLIDEDESRGDDFFKLKGGATVLAKVVKENFNNRDFHAIRDVEFEDREKDYKESLLDDMPCLDDLLIPADQEELAAALDAEDEDDDKKSKKSKAKSKKKDKDDDDEEDEEDDDDDDEDEDEDSDDEDDDDEDAEIEKGSTVTHKKHGTCKVTKINKDKDVVTLEDEDGEEHRGIKIKDVKLAEDEDEEDEEDEDEDEDEEEGDIEVGSIVTYVYKKKNRKGEVKKIKKDLVTIEEEDGEKRVMKMDELALADEDEDDEDEDDEDEKPAKKEKAKSKKKSKKKDDDDLPFDEDEDADEEEDEDEDEDDEDDEKEVEEEEKPKKKKKKK